MDKFIKRQRKANKEKEEKLQNKSIADKWIRGITIPKEFSFINIVII